MCTSVRSVFLYPILYTFKCRMGMDTRKESELCRIMAFKAVESFSKGMTHITKGEEKLSDDPHGNTHWS